MHLFRHARRVVSICGIFVAFASITAAFPMVALAATTRDLVCRTRLASLRTLAFVECFLVLELLGVLSAFAIWTLEFPWTQPSGKHFIERNYRLQRWWACALARAGTSLFRLRIQIKSDLYDPRGPMIVFFRHSSFMDTVLPIVTIVAKHGIRLRYVLKKELLWDPCLDIVGNRLPNVFIGRAYEEHESQLERIRNLTSDMSERDGVLIYPEGTRFSPAKRKRVLERLRQTDARAYADASEFHSVLPPRLGGSLTLLNSRLNADAVFGAHAGLESAATLKQILSGRIVGSTIQIWLWSIPSTDIPREPRETRSWFLEQWLKVDRLVTSEVSA